MFFTLVFFQKNTYIYIYIYIYTHTRIFSIKRIYIYEYIYIYIYICIYVYINTGISGDFLSPFPLKARKNRSTSSTQPSFGSPSLSGSMHRCRKSLGPQRGVVGSQATKSEPLILRAEKKKQRYESILGYDCGRKKIMYVSHTLKTSKNSPEHPLSPADPTGTGHPHCVDTFPTRFGGLWQILMEYILYIYVDPRKLGLPTFETWPTRLAASTHTIFLAKLDRHPVSVGLENKTVRNHQPGTDFSWCPPTI